MKTSNPSKAPRSAWLWILIPTAIGTPALADVKGKVIVVTRGCAIRVVDSQQSRPLQRGAPIDRGDRISCSAGATLTFEQPITSERITLNGPIVYWVPYLPIQRELLEENRGGSVAEAARPIDFGYVASAQSEDAVRFAQMEPDLQRRQGMPLVHGPWPAVAEIDSLGKVFRFQGRQEVSWSPSVTCRTSFGSAAIYESPDDLTRTLLSRVAPETNQNLHQWFKESGCLSVPREPASSSALKLATRYQIVPLQVFSTTTENLPLSMKWLLPATKDGSYARKLTLAQMALLNADSGKLVATSVGYSLGPEIGRELKSGLMKEQCRSDRVCTNTADLTNAQADAVEALLQELAKSPPSVVAPAKPNYKDRAPVNEK